MRNPAYERSWLEQACRSAGLSGLTERFVEAVSARLQKGAQEYGDDNFLSRHPRELTREIGEEPVDTAAWALLKAQAIQAGVLAGVADEETAVLKQVRLSSAAANALRAWADIEAVRELEIEEAEPVTTLTGKPFSHFHED